MPGAAATYPFLFAEEGGAGVRGRMTSKMNKSLPDPPAMAP